MVDLAVLNSGPTPLQKNFLNPICGSLTAGTIKAGPSLGPVVTSQYSLTSTVTVANTVLGSLTDTGTFVGSLVIPALPVGSIVKIRAIGSTSSTGASVNYALYIDGKQATSPTTYGGFNNNNIGILLDGVIAIKSSTVASLLLNAQMSGVTPNSNFQVAAPYLSTTSHQIDIFANISAASINNAFICGSFFVELSNVS